MAKYSSTDIGFFLVGGFDLLGVTTEITDPPDEAVMEDTTPINGAWVTNAAVGGRKSEFSQNGFFDDAAASINAAMADLEASSRVVCLGFQGNTIGKKFVGLAGAFAAKFTRVLQRMALTKANVAYTVTGQREEGVVLHTQSAETAASGNTQSTSVDNAASSANGGAGYLQVPALTLGGYTSVTVKVRHSADNSTFADLLTFTVVTAAQTAERVAVAGTVNRYTAMSWLFNGAGSGMSITPVVGFARG